MHNVRPGKNLSTADTLLRDLNKSDTYKTNCLVGRAVTVDSLGTTAQGRLQTVNRLVMTQ